MELWNFFWNFHARPKAMASTVSRQPENAWTPARSPRLLGRGFVLAYRFTLAPVLGPRCRHLPSCSEYAEEAIMRFGLWAGSWMALARVLRCHPWGSDGLDFVPAALPERAHWYQPWRYGRWRKTNPLPPEVES
jgi:putative membrane protein insertion efficiency factor